MGELVRERFRLFNERMRLALEDEGSPFEALAGSIRDNATSMAGDAATRFALMSGGEQVFEHAGEERDEFLRLARRLVLRARRSGELRPDFKADDIPMVMCGVCATIDKSAAGWNWRRHLEIVLAGMRASRVSLLSAPEPVEAVLRRSHTLLEGPRIGAAGSSSTAT